ncbi:hypothetical protein U1Q18_032069, partial [Sarracenia purpurea var. burkii]
VVFLAALGASFVVYLQRLSKIFSSPLGPAAISLCCEVKGCCQDTICLEYTIALIVFSISISSKDSVCRVEAWAESLGPSGLLSSATATVGVPCQYTGYGMLLVAAAMVLHLGDDSFNATVWQLLSLVDAPIGAVS